METLADLHIDIEEQLSGPGLAAFMIQSGYNIHQVARYLERRGFQTQAVDEKLAVSYSRNETPKLIAVTPQTSWLDELE